MFSRINLKPWIFTWEKVYKEIEDKKENNAKYF
jgi:hypothetical protein